MNKSFTLCLNMIVKDESHIIISTLTKLCKKVKFDYWVISDTGSTDDTKELIKDFFNLQNIKGELFEDKWVDFGYNRTLALNNAYNKTDYLFIFDADDILEGELIFPKNIFEYDSYLLNYGVDIIYKRKQIINNKKVWKYVGVLHEYIQCLEKDSTSNLNGNYYIISGKNGNRSNDINKYQKDAILLENAYNSALENNDPIINRYSFYCANSYKDAGDIDNAIKWYKNTLSLNNWNQEKYRCCLNLYYLYVNKKSIEQGIYYLIKSYEYDKTRIEGIYELIKYYCIENQNEIAYNFYTFIQYNYENNYINDSFSDKLFLDRKIYSFYLPYYMIIVCEKLKKYDIALKIINILFTKDDVRASEWWVKNIIYNLQFFLDKNKELELVNKWNSYIKKINNKNYNIDRNLINQYEIYNISNFLQLFPSNKNKIIYDDDDDADIVVAILAKNNEISLPFYLQCIYNQTYDKSFIHLYIRTNDNIDNTQDIILDFINTYGHEYASICYNDTDITEELKKYKNYEWNKLRFHILGEIRQESINHAIKFNAHYFVVDCDNFIIPSTIENMMKNKNMGIISPMLKNGSSDITNNFYYDVDKNGYFKDNKNNYSILNHDIFGLIRVCCVYSAYFIPKTYLSLACYNDDSDRAEYVIFSESLRKYSIPQYIDNTEEYGYISFLEDKNLFEIENNYWKSTLFK